MEAKAKPEKGTHLRPSHRPMGLDSATLLQRYEITMQFVSPMYGQVPADPDVVGKWLAARAPQNVPPDVRSLAEIREEVIATTRQEIAEAAQSDGAVDADLCGVLQFQTVDGALVVRAATLRAHAKDCARVISTMVSGRIAGEKSFSARFTNAFYQDPSVYWVPIIRLDGSPVTEPDSVETRFVHVQTPRGPRNGIKRLDTIHPPAVLRWTAVVLGGAVCQEDIESVFLYGGVHGYGGERSLDGGKYTATVRRI